MSKKRSGEKLYEVVIDSWENDADSPEEVNVTGCTMEDVHFFVTMFSQFTSKNNQERRGVGNDVCSYGQLVEMLECTMGKVDRALMSRWLLKEIDVALLTEEEALYDWVCGYIGHPENDYYVEMGNFCRVVEAIRVLEYPAVPRDISNQFEGAGKL